MKPIEVGCQAIIITNQKGNLGKQVRAELLIPSDGCFVHGELSYTNHVAKKGIRVWKVSGQNLTVGIEGKLVNLGWTTVCEAELMRIDGGDFKEDENLYSLKDKGHTNA